MVVVNGTFYNKNTPHTVIDILERCRQGLLPRLKIWYGDSKTGKVWGDVYRCKVGRSMGPVKIPLAILKANASGGEGILDDAIVRIDHANKKNGGTLWQHPKWHLPPDFGTPNLHG